MLGPPNQVSKLPQNYDQGCLKIFQLRISFFIMVQIFERCPILVQIGKAYSKKALPTNAESFLMLVFELNQTWQIKLTVKRLNFTQFCN